MQGHIRRQTFSQAHEKELRRFLSWELAEPILRVNQNTFRGRLAADAPLPSGEVEPDGRQRWFSLDEIDELRRRMKANRRSVMPERPANRRAIRVAAANFKGGAGKSTTALHLGHPAALDGYRVLTVDFDPQGDAQPVDGDHTVLGYHRPRPDPRDRTDERRGPGGRERHRPAPPPRLRRRSARRRFPAGRPVADPEADLPDGIETKSMTQRRRGPMAMATAIGETGHAWCPRQRIEADIRAENDRLAHEFVRQKTAGLVTDIVPIDLIATTKLTRDHNPAVDLDLDELKASLRDLGLSNPIRVEEVASGQYELIEGYRSRTAYRELLAETGDPHWSHILVVLSVPVGTGVRCTTADGKGEMRDRVHFSPLDRDRPERAIAAFFAELDGGNSGTG